jgi:hypothetical protein
LIFVDLIFVPVFVPILVESVFVPIFGDAVDLPKPTKIETKIETKIHSMKIELNGIRSGCSRE